MQAVNGAGYVTYASSPAFTVDGSPPNQGIVNEVTSGQLETDIDYQVFI